MSTRTSSTLPKIPGTKSEDKMTKKEAEKLALISVKKIEEAFDVKFLRSGLCIVRRTNSSGRDRHKEGFRHQKASTRYLLLRRNTKSKELRTSSSRRRTSDSL
jgi:hypothetical protein